MTDEGSTVSGRQRPKVDLIPAIPSLRAFAVSICGNPDRADDLVQETLVKAWSSLDSFEEGTNLTAWIAARSNVRSMAGGSTAPDATAACPGIPMRAVSG